MDIHQSLFGSGGQHHAGREGDALGSTARTKEVFVLEVANWNEGYETSDTRKSKKRLIWVRSNILTADLNWARLWTREDAAQVWAGWTAIVWFAAQATPRGTITDAKEISLLTRVPEEFVSLAIKWGADCGWISGEICEISHIPTTSGNDPDSIPTTSGNDRDYVTLRTEQDTTTTRASASPVVAAKEEPAGKIVQAAWADLLDEGYKAVRFRAWSPDMTRQARALAKIYKDYDFDDLFRRALGVMVNDPWLKEHPHHFNAHRIMRPEIFAMYADKCEIPEETPPELPIECLQ